MTEKQDVLVLGVTGSFGSGCSTLSEALEKLGFAQFSLSAYVRDAWAKKYNRDPKEAKKFELQNMGNELRETKGDAYLATLAARDANAKTDGKKRLVFSSIRNLAEVEYLRREFRNFFLVAVDCSPTIRWERIKDDYKKMGQDEEPV